MSTRRASLLLSLLWVALLFWQLLAVTGAVYAQTPEATPDPSTAGGPSANDVAGALLSGLGTVISEALTSWFQTSAPVVFGKLVTAAFGTLADFLWSAAGPLFGGVNVFTQLPAPWSYDLRPVGELRGRLEPLARAVLLLSLVLGVAWVGIGAGLGRPFGRALSALPTFLLATGGLLVAPQLTRWWIDFCNAASAALLDPTTGLPGLAEVRSWEQASALGVVALIYLLCALLLLLHRLKLVVICALLLVVAPLAVAAGALPFPQAQRFFHWWLSTFLGTTFVQVLQAVCLGLGAALLSAPFVNDAVEGPAQGMLSASVGIGAIMASMSLPGMLLGTLSRANLAPGVLNTALQAATMLAGFGVAWRTAAGVGFAWARPVPPVGLPAGPAGAPGGGRAVVTPVQSGYVRSLLAGAPSVPALPPPQT